MFRIGHGYDIHRFEDIPTKDYIMLGGVQIPYERGIVAHSDGDVLLHAICDALLGACALGDIGSHFPDMDPKYKNCDSRLLLKEVKLKIQACGYSVNNIDASIIAEKPKMQPFIMAMQETIAQDLDVSINCISIKARTNERLDAIGNRQGIAVHVVALLIGM